jgi:penicillin amidase
VIGSFFNITVLSAGGDYTLNRGKVDFAAETPFVNRYGSSYRAIYDFANLNRSLYIQPTGQSGNPFSPLYRTFVDRWAKGEYIQIPTRRDEVNAMALGIWRLAPD